MIIINKALLAQWPYMSILNIKSCEQAFMETSCQEFEPNHNNTSSIQNIPNIKLDKLMKAFA